jgi:hypothetical protein
MSQGGQTGVDRAALDWAIVRIPVKMTGDSGRT